MAILHPYPNGQESGCLIRETFTYHKNKRSKFEDLLLGKYHSEIHECSTKHCHNTSHNNTHIPDDRCSQGRLSLTTEWLRHTSPCCGSLLLLTSTSLSISPLPHHFHFLPFLSCLHEHLQYKTTERLTLPVESISYNTWLLNYFVVQCNP